MLSTEQFDVLKELVAADKPGTIVNSSVDLDKTVHDTTPVMTGRSTPALQEIHIFLAPTWTDASDNLVDMEMVARYDGVIKAFNDIMKTPKVMKNPLLALKFQEIGFVYVMQSSLYVLTDDKDDIIKTTHMLADLFATAGFTVIREKVEASLYGIDGIPKTAEEIAAYPKTYYEFHIRVKHHSDDKTPLSGDEHKMLEEISDQFTKKYETPVPLSYNKATHPDGGYQRYLNVRFRGCGAPYAIERVNEIKDHINTSTTMKVEKIIAEYVWYDTFVELDKGWIDF